MHSWFEVSVMKNEKAADENLKSSLGHVRCLGWSGEGGALMLKLRCFSDQFRVH